MVYLRNVPESFANLPGLSFLSFEHILRMAGHTMEDVE